MKQKKYTQNVKQVTLKTHYPHYYIKYENMLLIFMYYSLFGFRELSIATINFEMSPKKVQNCVLL